MHEARIESAATDKQGHVIVRWDINNKTNTVNLKDVTPMLHQRKRIKRAPTRFGSEKKTPSFKSPKTSSTIQNSSNYTTPMDWLKGMSKKGKNMVLRNKPTRIKCKVDSGQIPLLPQIKVMFDE